MAFEPAPLLIGLREGLEALLVLGIVLGMLDRMEARDRRPIVWAGFGVGILVSLGAGILIDRLFASRFEEGGAAVFEIVVALAAVGVLTYMVLWMQRNARAMTEGLKHQVEQAVLKRQVWVLAFLGFITVVREGLEVVLFYSALSTTISWGDIILWGLVGFAVSAAIAFAIFRLTVRVDLQKFFAVTGLLLIFIAAGLLVHVVHAASEVGVIGHATPLWDTSGFMPDEDHWLGGPLHALIGYEDQPTLLQLVLYLGYLVGVGGYYLSNLMRPERRPRSQRIAAGAIIFLLAILAVGAAVPTEDDPGAAGAHGGHGAALYGHDLPDHLDHKVITSDAAALLESSGARVAVLIRSHGEPVHYNASTYESFKQFIRGIWPYTGLPAELLEVDQGTYYIDDSDPFGSVDGMPEDLVDAWLGPAPLPGAVPVTDPLGLGAASDVTGLAGGDFYFLPGPVGAGSGEGDVFEILGLGSYRLWLKMENESPKYQQTKDHVAWMEGHLANHFGDQVKAFYAYHIDPWTDPDLKLSNAIQNMVDWQPDIVLDSYHSSVHSDAMNTCMMRPHAMHLLHEAGYTGPIVDVGMAGHHKAWGEAVAGYITANADHFGDHEAVSIHLAQHGGNPQSTNPCGDGEEPDQYRANLLQQYDVTKAVLESHFGDRFTIRNVYGQGGDEPEGEPENGALSPMEAIALDKDEGIHHSVIVPYEFWSDAMDNLVPLRESLGMTVDQAPYYDNNYETHLTMDGVHIDVWSAHYGVHEKGTAHLAAISEAMVQALS